MIFSPDGMTGASGITRSIPAHGLNGGVFPPCSNSAIFTNTLLSQSTNGQEVTVKNRVQSNGHILPNGFHSSPVIANANGQLPNQANNGVCTSSNGYYGFQSTSAEANGGSEECDMETDASPVSISQNGSANEQKIGVATGFVNGQGRTPNGQTDKITLEFTNGDVIGTVLGFTNGHSVGNASRMACGINGTCPNGLDGNTLKNHNNLGQDITLNHGISQNHIPVAGCKRSREEGFIPEIKRMKTEGKICVPSLLSSDKALDRYLCEALEYDCKSAESDECVEATAVMGSEGNVGNQVSLPQCLYFTTTLLLALSQETSHANLCLHL